MLQTRSEAWERVGLAVDVDRHAVRRAQRELIVLVPLLVAVLVLFDHCEQWFGIKQGPLVRTVTVILVLALGWMIARAIGRAAGPTFFRRMDPATAGPVGFLIRLATVAVTLLIALSVAGVSAATVVAGSAFTAVVVGLAAQQTLGNLFAGVVLLSARPFRVGERVRLQAGAVGGTAEGIVSSQGLLYTTLVQEGEDQIMIPNNVVLASAIVPLKEPDSVDVKVRLPGGVRLTRVQAILDDRLTTPTRRRAIVELQEIAGDDVLVRVQATPANAADGAKLADEIIALLASVTGEHVLSND
jgi:small-conductance mechanosensitive channel